MAGRMTKREHHIFNVLKKENPGLTDSHIWAMVEGMSPKTLQRKFKTTPRTYSTTHKKAAAARRAKGR